MTSPHGGVNLKTKAEVRGNKHLPEIRRSERVGVLEALIQAETWRTSLSGAKGKGCL